MTLTLAVLVVLLTAVGQLLLKTGATRRRGARLFNRYVFAGYALFVVVVMLSYYLMRIIDLKYFTAIMSMSYVAVALASRLFLREKMGVRRAVGTVLVFIGVSIFMMH